MVKMCIHNVSCMASALTASALKTLRQSLCNSIPQHCLNDWTETTARWEQGWGRMRGKAEANMGNKETISHQVGHDVMVAFDMFPDTDNL